MPPSAPHTHARFLPGAMVAGRYRIVALLGRGGMGEVYRADDVKLGEAVALKFLPERLENDASLRERFLGEARLARQVAHPNVCRVYDVGDVGGRLFLSMEYVDGEDLATLLRRIGRLPEDKAVQIAHEICAGLHAAHEQGIVHRDLKPSNVMLDGRGRARITDFGLAALAGGIDAADVSAGTPAYMAPEQLAGQDVTVRSDVYALGLVLYELFTGRAAFEAATWAEQLQAKRSSTPRTLTQAAPYLDPAIERVVLRCLQPDPNQRPASAASVALALPGGDPLAAALAAGETPSPEMVAGHGGEEAVAPARAWGWFAAFVVALALVFAGASHFYLIQRVPIEKPPAVLLDRAREIAKELGWNDPPGDESTLMYDDTRYGDAVTKRFGQGARIDHLRRYPAGTFYMLYRRSPVPMHPVNDFTSSPNASDPPLTTPGMLSLNVDGTGKLVSLQACPPDLDTLAAGDAVPSVDWTHVFALAGLDTARFRPVTPQWTPGTFADERRAWLGTVPGDSVFSLRIEAASYRGRPVLFRRIYPWTTPVPTTSNTGALGWIVWGVFIALLALATWAARRNLREGRADARGALRLGLAGGVFIVLRFWFDAHLVPDPQWLFSRLLRTIGFGGLFFLVLTVLYLTLEPIVRRTWPHVLVSWMRLLDARWRDRRLARDVIAGLVTGAALIVFDFAVAQLVTRLTGRPLSAELIDSPSAQTDAIMGLGQAMSVVLVAASAALQSALTGSALVALLTVVTKRERLAVVLAGVAMILLGGSNGTIDALGYALLVVTIGATMLLMVRYGFVTMLTSLFTQSVLSLLPLALPGTSWYWPTTAVGLVVLLGLALWSLRTMLMPVATATPAPFSAVPSRTAAPASRAFTAPAPAPVVADLENAATEYSPRPAGPGDLENAPTQFTPRTAPSPTSELESAPTQLSFDPPPRDAGDPREH